jgi:hypothetical protein
MESAFDMLCDVLPANQGWKIKVRVIRLWPVYSFMKPDEINSLEMVLLDDKVV